jgi:hypothetical protein
MTNLKKMFKKDMVILKYGNLKIIKKRVNGPLI